MTLSHDEGYYAGGLCRPQVRLHSLGGSDYQDLRVKSPACGPKN